MKKFRKEKINEQLKRELSELIVKEIKDPRIRGFITITKVDVSGDMQHAKVYVTIFGISEKDKKKCFKGLKSSGNYLQYLLLKRLRLRYVPVFEFIYDESISRGFDIIEKLDKIKAETQADD